MLSTLRPTISHPRSLNSLWRLANSMNSVVQTGVKSAGWAKSRTHLPRNCDRVMGPLVVLAVKSGAFDPILTMVTSFEPSLMELSESSLALLVPISPTVAHLAMLIHHYCNP